jgi:hypothetical protein
MSPSINHGLAEGLVREVLGIPIAKRRALDAIVQSGLFQRIKSAIRHLHPPTTNYGRRAPQKEG